VYNATLGGTTKVVSFSGMWLCGGKGVNVNMAVRDNRVSRMYSTFLVRHCLECVPCSRSLASNF